MDQVARRACVAFTLGSALALTPSVAHPQDVATLAGRVIHKQSKAGIPGAEVTVAPGDLRIATDPAGHFRFDRVPPGIVSVVVRRLGFAPESASFEVRLADDLDLLIELEQTAQPLDTVMVAGRENPLARGKLSGYYERKRFGIGRFIDGDMLEKEQYRQLGDIITSRAAGSRLVRSRLGSAAWIATARRSGVTLLRGSAIDESDRMRGADPMACYPDVWVDGTLVYQYGVRGPLFDVNSIGTGAVAAVELYVGPARVPSQYNRTNAVCGVLLIWTK